jgi:hypothetical protein
VNVIFFAKFDSAAPKLMNPPLGRLPFAPSLEWLITRRIAHHVRICNVETCQLCAFVFNDGHSSHPVVERIKLALQGEDALGWIKVAAAHENTDRIKAEAIMSYLAGAKVPEQASMRLRLNSSVLCTVEFTIDGRPITARFVEGRLSRGLSRYLEHDGEYIGVYKFPHSAYKIGIRTNGEKLIYKYSYAYYAIMEDVEGSSLAALRAKRVLRELLANDILRVRWIPFSKVRRSVDPERSSLKVEYAQCERRDADEAATVVIRI